MNSRSSTFGLRHRRYAPERALFRGLHPICAPLCLLGVLCGLFCKLGLFGRFIVQIRQHMLQAEMNADRHHQYQNARPQQREFLVARVGKIFQVRQNRARADKQ